MSISAMAGQHAMSDLTMLVKQQLTVKQSIEDPTFLWASHTSKIGLCDIERGDLPYVSVSSVCRWTNHGRL